MNAKFTRREFVHLSGVTAACAVLAAAGSTPTATAAPAKPSAAPTATPAAAVTTLKTFGQMVAEAMAVVPSITAAEAQQRMERGRIIPVMDVRDVFDVNTLVIDVRDAADIVASGIIPGAVAISYGSLTYQADNGVPAEWRSPQLTDRSRPIITYCQAGPLGALAGKLLHDMGFTNVSILAGGMQVWKSAGFPTQAFRG